ncbi:unnamed protein product [Mytilus coruscus]|uniref:Uncharacterized protein n=1 Tax=Mytilus coruscus TaxID=42192 RepID=A0A6J8ENA2_MYTCO|nr:unnamed protein product [Mytilus coruscus]
MDQYMNFPMCTNGGSGHFVNNSMMNPGLVPVSTYNYSVAFSSERKRQLSDQMSNYTNEPGTEHKKTKCDSSVSSAPMFENTNRVEALILQLSSNFSNMSEKLDKRISELETNFEERVSEKLSEKISVMIDNKMKEKLIEVKTEVKHELDGMKSKIENLEKQVSENKTNNPYKDLLRNKFIIKNLEFDDREKTDPELTKHKVQGLLKDCLGLSNVKLKAKLKNNRLYANVYIENDMSPETRNFQSTVRTVLKEMGKEKNSKFVGNRLLPKET